MTSTPSTGYGTCTSARTGQGVMVSPSVGFGGVLFTTPVWNVVVSAPAGDVDVFVDLRPIDLMEPA